MTRSFEIERKFLVKQLPPRWRKSASSKIIQGYFPMAGRDLEIRLRRNGPKHFITIKAGHGLRRLEQEIEISEPSFRALWPLTLSARIAKRRYRIPCHEHVIELDVYEGRHRGLVTAEIEFGSIRESRAFQGPEWLGREITASRQYANQALARRRGLPCKQTISCAH